MLPSLPAEPEAARSATSRTGGAEWGFVPKITQKESPELWAEAPCWLRECRRFGISFCSSALAGDFCPFCSVWVRGGLVFARKTRNISTECHAEEHAEVSIRED